MNQVLEFLSGKTPKSLFLALKFDGKSHIDALGRVIQKIISEGKEVNAEQVYISCKNITLLDFFMELAN